MKGSDPEVFIVNDKNYCVPPVYFRLNELIEVQDNSNEQHPVFYKDDRIKIIEDGSAFEFNTKPTDDPHEYYDIVQHGINILNKIIPSEYKVSVSPVVKFSLSKFVYDNHLKPFYEYCCRFGCDPDIDIYSGLYCQQVNASKIKERYGGGHIHISSNNDYNIKESSGIPELNDNVIKQTKLFDIVLGNAFVLQSKIPGLDIARQKYYGRPGKIRIQNYGNTYGIEYRTPSNSWITNLDSIELMFSAVDLALELYNLPESNGIISRYLKRSINNILTFNKSDSEKVWTELFK